MDSAVGVEDSVVGLGAGAVGVGVEGVWVGSESAMGGRVLEEAEVVDELSVRIL